MPHVRHRVAIITAIATVAVIVGAGTAVALGLAAPAPTVAMDRPSAASLSARPLMPPHAPAAPAALRSTQAQNPDRLAFLPLAIKLHVPPQTVPTAQPPPSPTEDVAPAEGPRLFKSGPVQITADGRWLWVADAHANSLSRIDTESRLAQTFRTSDTPTGDHLKGLSVMEDGSQVWAAAHDTDRIYVLDGQSGALATTIQLPWGCGPYGIALSPPVDGEQAWALVGCIRASSLIAIDTATHVQTRVSPVFRSPFGVAWTDAESAWVTHLYPDELHPHITGLTFGSGAPEVSTHLWFAAASPRNPSLLKDPIAARNVPEGGYVALRGHPARYPGEKKQLWIPTQYHNVEPPFQRETYGPQPDAAQPAAAFPAQQAGAFFTPESIIQASVRRFDLSSHRLSVEDKIILTAQHVHDPTQGERNPPWIGYGWEASVSGLVDTGFSVVDGRLYTALLAEQSDELLFMPADTPPIRSATDPNAPGLPELRVGQRPMGLAVHPTKALAYTYNSQSFDVSEIDLSDPKAPAERRRIAVAGAEPWSPIALQGARDGGALFHGSADPRISADERVSCATCHINAEHDGRTWAFQGLPAGTAGQGHGMRGVPTLLGLADRFATGQRDARFGWGQLHISGDRDEIQDFEHTFQSALMGGTGFLGDQVQPELGPPNAGRSAELDSLADYLLRLEPLPRSPHRNADGSLSEAAIRGAASFLGDDPTTRPADAACAGCHVPETAFLDHGFHDIGRRRDALEQELNDSARRGACLWCVNTASLVGAWDTAPYAGIAGWEADTLRAFLEDLGRPGRPAPHGAVAQLSAPQRADLAAFVGSIDGDLRAPEVRGLRDRTPPRIARVSVTSLTRLEVWFSEAIARDAASDPAAWRIVRQRDDQALPVSRVAWDARNNDHVSLYAQLAIGEAYRLLPVGPIPDLADQASGGAANLLDATSAANQPRFEVGDSLTITLGASGYENLDIPVHDASPVGPNPQSWSIDRIRLIVEGGTNVPGFVRFDWQEAMRQETGLTDAGRLEAAAFELRPWAGDAQLVELRRVLQPWSDPADGRDPNHDPVGAPTWRDHSHPDQPWNLPGAGRRGGRGDQVSDYDGPWDVAAEVDLSLHLSTVNAPVRFEGDAITQAFRFWLEHPDQDYGYALHLTGGPARPFLEFRGWEEDAYAAGPRLWLTYRP